MARIASNIINCAPVVLKDFRGISFQIVSVEFVVMFGVILIVLLQAIPSLLSTSKLGTPQGAFPQNSVSWGISISWGTLV